MLRKLRSHIKQIFDLAQSCVAILRTQLQQVRSIEHSLLTMPYHRYLSSIRNDCIETHAGIIVNIIRYNKVFKQNEEITLRPLVDNAEIGELPSEYYEMENYILDRQAFILVLLSRQIDIHRFFKAHWREASRRRFRTRALVDFVRYLTYYEQRLDQMLLYAEC